MEEQLRVRDIQTIVDAALSEEGPLTVSLTPADLAERHKEFLSWDGSLEKAEQRIKALIKVIRDTKEEMSRGVSESEEKVQRQLLTNLRKDLELWRNFKTEWFGTQEIQGEIKARDIREKEGSGRGESV
jgi:hypothetical protein